MKPDVVEDLLQRSRRRINHDGARDAWGLHDPATNSPSATRIPRTGPGARAVERALSGAGGPRLVRVNQPPSEAPARRPLLGSVPPLLPLNRSFRRTGFSLGGAAIALAIVSETRLEGTASVTLPTADFDVHVLRLPPQVASVGDLVTLQIDFVAE